MASGVKHALESRNMESIISGTDFEREEVALQDNEPGKAGSGHPLEAMSNRVTTACKTSTIQRIFT